jgi:O-antigen/teichoic acid export membrane protein
VGVRATQSSLRGDFGWSAAFLAISRVAALAAVPVVLDQLGTELYGVWVLAGTVVFSQSLVDLGTGASLVRYAAMAREHDARGEAHAILRRGLLFYGALSLVVVAPGLLAAEEIADAMPFLSDARVADGAVLIRYAAAAFALTNGTVVLVSILQGLGRVNASFRAQSLGWLTYVPLLLAGKAVAAGPHAVGFAWVGAFGVQLVILFPATRRALGALGAGKWTRTPLRDMVSLGAQWQVSSWADFATFQAPRLISGAALPAQALLAVDLALRFGQAVASPILAVLPLVLPRASAAFAYGGTDAVRALAARLHRLILTSAVLLTTCCAPVAALVIATWAGVPSDDVGVFLAIAVVAGTMAHASTGVLSSVLLATGELAEVMRYKTCQLILALVLVATAAAVGGTATSVGVALVSALALPAISFNHRVSQLLGLPRFWRDAAARLMAAAGVSLLPSLLAVSAISESPAGVTLIIAITASALGLLIGGTIALGRGPLRSLRHSDPDLRTASPPTDPAALPPTST